MGVEVHISGLQELQQKLDALPTKLAKRVLRPSLEDAGAIIQQAIGVRAPRQTGFLTTHIGVDVVVHNDLSASVKVGPEKGQASMEALFAELGTAPHTETSKNGKSFTHPGQPATPFIRPAFAESSDAALTALVTNIKDGLSEVAK